MGEGRGRRQDVNRGVRVIRSRNMGKKMHSSRERGPLWLCRPAAGPSRGQAGVSCMLMPGDLGTGNGAGITAAHRQGGDGSGRDLPRSSMPLAERGSPNGERHLSMRVDETEHGQAREGRELLRSRDIVVRAGKIS